VASAPPSTSVKTPRAGELLTRENLRVIRPGCGRAPKHYESLLGRPVNRDLPMGIAMAWE
jgi:N-acetylneuraminate synthase